MRTAFVLRAVLLSALLAPLAAHAGGTAPAVAPPTALPVVTVTTAAPSVPTTTIVSGTVTITNPPDTGYRLLIEYGEGRERDENYLHATDTCTTRAGATEKHQFRHAYRMAGVWTIRATLILGCGLGPANPRFAGATPIQVTAGQVVSNGPFRPHAWMIPVPPDDFVYPPGVTDPPPPPPPYTRQPGDDGQVIVVNPGRGPWKSWGVFNVFASDEDGYLTQVKIVWGDRSQNTIVMYPNSECDEPVLKQHWPKSNDVQTLKHPFKKGRYTTTVTITTRGCDGKDAQTVTHRLVHTAV